MLPGGVEVPVCQQGNCHMLCDEIENRIHALAFQFFDMLAQGGFVHKKKLRSFPEILGFCKR